MGWESDNDGDAIESLAKGTKKANFDEEVLSDWDADSDKDSKPDKIIDKPKIACKGPKISLEEKKKKREEEVEAAKILAAEELKRVNMTSKEREELAKESELEMLADLMGDLKQTDQNTAVPSSKEEFNALEKRIIQQFTLLESKPKKKKGTKLVAERDNAYAEHGAAKEGVGYEDYEEFL